MFIEPTITWVPSGFSGYIWLDTKIVLKKTKNKKKQGVLVERRDCSFGKEETTLIRIVERATEVQKRV